MDLRITIVVIVSIFLIMLITWWMCSSHYKNKFVYQLKNHDAWVLRIITILFSNYKNLLSEEKDLKERLLQIYNLQNIITEPTGGPDSALYDALKVEFTNKCNTMILEIREQIPEGIELKKDESSLTKQEQPHGQ